MNLLLDIISPKKCVGCNKEGSHFCPTCISNILQTDLICPKCSKKAIGGQTHPICQSKFGLDGLWSLGIYQNPLREAIKRLKYNRVKELAQSLAEIMVEYWVKYQPFVLEQITKDKGVGWTIIPIPLYWWRGNDRGFNQSAEIGQNLSKRLGLDYLDGLKRVRYTQPQVKLKGWDRRQNIKGVFEISKHYTLNPSPYVLLIDDVWTTGSTLKECCYILKKAGAKKVWALTLAR